MQGESRLSSSPDTQASMEEQAFIGSLMIDATDFPQVAMIIDPSDFTVQMNSDIYKTMLKCLEFGEPVDDAVFLQRRCCEDNPRLNKDMLVDVMMDAMTSVPTASNVFYYARIIKERTNKRIASKEIASLADTTRKDDPPYRTIVEGIMSIQDRIPPIPSEEVSMRDELEKFIDYLENPSEDGLTGKPVSFDIDMLDQNIVDCGPGRIVTVGGWTSHGKSTLAVKSIRSCLRNGMSVLLMSYEMERRAYLGRIVCQMASESAGVSLQKINRPESLTPEDLKHLKSAKEFLSDASERLWIYEAPTIDEAHSLVIQHRPDLFIVDYIQAAVYKGSRVSSDESYRERINSFMVNSKDLALKYKSRGLILSQARRLKDDNPRRPRMTDMMESSALENHSDVVIMVYWPDKLDGCCPEVGPMDGQDERSRVSRIVNEKTRRKGLSPDHCYYEVIMEKNRNGATPIIPCTIIPHTTEIYCNSIHDRPSKLFGRDTYPDNAAQPGSEDNVPVIEDYSEDDSLWE